MILKESELFEYIKCPLRYDIISKGNILGENKSFKKLCYEAINHFYNAKSNGMKADSNTLKRKWDIIAFNNQEHINSKKVLEGWGMLYRAFEYTSINEIEFSAINLSYNIEIPGTGVCLVGVLDPIIDKGTHIEIFITSFDKQLPDRVDIDSRLKHTIDAYAIKKLFNKEVVITYYVPAQGKTMRTIRSTADFNRLESIVKNVGKAINDNIIYPRETFTCNMCNAKAACKAWTGETEVN